MKRNFFGIVSVFFICGISFLPLFSARANAATLYFSDSTTYDGTWNTVGNWWTDSGETVPAGRIPITGDDVVVNTGTTIGTGPSTPVTLNTLTDTMSWMDAGAGITVTNGAIFGLHDGTYQATLSGGTITGTTTVTGNSYLRSGGTFTNAIFNENSDNYGTITGNATFNDSTSNQGTVSGTATFNGGTYNEWNGTVGTGIFNDTSNNGGVVTTAVFNSSSYNNSGSTITTATFNGSSYNSSGTIDTATFNNSSLNQGTVNTSTFNDSSQNAGSAGDATFNDTSTNAGDVTVTAIFNGDASEYQSGTVEFAERRYTSDISITRDFTSDPFYWTVVAYGAVVNIKHATYDANTTFTTQNGGSFTSASTIYANASTGSDSTGDGTSGAPYKTFSKAYTSASAGDTLNLTGTFTETDSGETGSASVSGFTIGKNITIVGQGAGYTIIQASAASSTANRRVFTISSGVTATISGVTIRNGQITGSSDYGGGIEVLGILTLENSEVTNNYANNYYSWGGGIYATGAALTITDSTVDSNFTSGGGGGGIYYYHTGGTLTVTNSTVYGNRRTATTGNTEGAGIYDAAGNAILTNDTIAGNSATTGAAGFSMDDPSGYAHVANTIIAGNTDDSGTNYQFSYRQAGYGNVVDGGNNIIGGSNQFYTWSDKGDWKDPSNTGTFTNVGNSSTGAVNFDTALSMNDNTSTYVPTLAILSGSVAINNATSTVNDGVAIPETDERGASRNGAADIGAFEYNGGGLTVSAPSTQASSILFSSVQYNKMTIGWTAGNGARRVVFIKQASSGTASPSNGTTYTPNAVFGSGSQIDSSGWYAVYDGHGASITVTGLTSATDYTVEVFEYNGIDTGTAAYDTSTATGNPATQATYTPTTVYANASTGSDSGGGTSGSPYKTFNKAYTSANPGDTLDLTGTFSWSTESGNASTTGYTIAKDISIVGHTPANTIIEAHTASTSASARVFTVSAGHTVSMSDLMIRNGRLTSTSYDGGGIQNNGTLTLSDVDINNDFAGGGGGGVSNYATLYVQNSSIRDNFSTYAGGGITQIGMTASSTLTNVTVSGNTQTSSSGSTDGGGIQVYYGPMTITNSTIAHNTSYSYGGGIYLANSSAALTVENTIIANNSVTSGGATTGSDVGKYTSASIVDNGYNIVGRSNGYSWSATGDWTDTNNDGSWAKQGGGSGSLALDTALANNNNPHFIGTLALTSGSSVAVDNGTTNTNSFVAVPSTDQRGATRSGATDIGAYEYNGGGLTTYYTLTYAAGSNGSVSGTSPQSVASGASGSAVTAVPNSGYHFVQWSDASTTNPRTDTDVVSDITVSAAFAANDTNAPSISLTAPTSNEATSTASVTFTAAASDDVAVGGVTFYVDGTKIGSEITSGSGGVYTSAPWDSTATSSGVHTAFAVARDTSNNYATSSPPISFIVDNTKPIVSLTAPTASEATSSMVTLSASASDANTSVAGVKFYVDGTLQGSEVLSPPYAVYWDSTATSSGTHTAFAVARDAVGNYATSSPAVSFTVSNSGPTPTAVRYTGISDGATFTWTTASAASSQLWFGIISYASSTPEADTAPRVTSHTVALSGLTSCTAYHYAVVGSDASANTATSSDAVFKTSGCTGDAPITGTGASTVAVISGGTLAQGDITLTAPSSFTATSSAVTFQANQLGGTAFFAAAGAPANMSKAGSAVFELKALIDATTTLSSFDQPLTVTLSYTPSDIADIDESTLEIYRYDAGVWTPLSGCSVDTSAHTVTCETSNFSDFAIFGKPLPSGSNGTSSGGGGSMIFGSGPLAPGYQVGGSLAVAAATSAPTSYVFTRLLKQNMTGTDVEQLQAFLNSHGYPLTSSGPGSPGNETTYFGQLTKNALISFQEAHSSAILTPVGLSAGTGFFGPMTVKFVNKMLTTVK